jgi:CBS domain-containing protein
MSSVLEILQYKGSTVHTTREDTPLMQALADMSAHEVEGLIVLDGTALVGIVTSNDYLRKVIGGGLDLVSLKVGDVMTRHVSTVGPEVTASQCVAMMSKGRFRHLPVVDKGEVIGVVTMVDIMRFNADRGARVAELDAVPDVD